MVGPSGLTTERFIDKVSLYLWHACVFHVLLAGLWSVFFAALEHSLDMCLCYLLLINSHNDLPHLQTQLG